MPREAAAERLTALIDALPRDPASANPSQTSAADLVALLPNGKAPGVQSVDNAFSATGSRQQQVVLAFCTFAIMILAVFAISTFVSPAPGTRVDRATPRAADAPILPPGKPFP